MLLSLVSLSLLPSSEAQFGFLANILRPIMNPINSFFRNTNNGLRDLFRYRSVHCTLCLTVKCRAKLWDSP